MNGPENVPAANPISDEPRAAQPGEPSDSTLPPPPPPPFTPPIDSVTKEERTWAMIAHLSAFAYYFSGIGHILGPLIIWLIKKDESKFIGENAKEALNFQISVTIYGLVALALCLILIGIPLLIGLHIFQIVCIIVGGLKAYDGKTWRYPGTIRFL